VTTLAALVAAAPAPTRGKPTGFVHGAGEWRHVVELADPAAGSSVVWYDVTAIEGAFVGYNYSRGSDGYQGRYRASVVTLDVYAGNDSLAPWNPDTSPTFGTHVKLGTGLLMRSGFIRVDGGVVVEWNPRFTNKVEFWGDSSYSRGKVRQHRIIARDTLTSLVGVPLPARPEENWSERLAALITNAGWQYGSNIYGAEFTSGAADILTLPARTAQTSAVTELDATLDPVGLIWYTNRLGQLVVRPRVNDTFHTDAFLAGATGNEWSTSGTPVTFDFAACAEVEGEAPLENASYAVDTPGVEPFGLDDSERWVINHVKVTDPVTPGFDGDDPVSIQRHDRHTLQASWQAANDVVADSILELRANATVEARPLTTTVDMPGFHPGPATVDYLGYCAVLHQNQEGGYIATANGWLRDYRERVLPRGCDTDWTMVFTLDVYNVTAEFQMLPVEDLTLVDVTETSAEFSWTNPPQEIEPTHTQVRMLNPASLWATVAYPLTGLTWSGLDPSTAYEFQVRLVRIVDGLITHFSPTRSIVFVTDPTTVPHVEPDPDNPGEFDVTLPTPDDPTLCIVVWELQQSATGLDPWTTIDSGNVTIPPYTIDLDLSGEDPEQWYRVRSREVCDLVPGPWVYSAVFPPECIPVSQLGVAPYDDDALVAYFPRICPDTVTEAISEETVTLGPAFLGFNFDDDGVPILLSAGEGLIAYGIQPLPAVESDEDLSISVRIKLGTQPDDPVTLFGYGGLSIEVTADGAGFGVQGNCVEVGPTVTTISGASVLALDTEYVLTLTHDVAAGDLVLYVDGINEVDALGTVGERFNFGLYEMNLPADSWITDCAVWDRVIIEPPVPGITGVVNHWDVSDASTILTGSTPTVYDLVGTANLSGAGQSWTTQNGLDAFVGGAAANLGALSAVGLASSSQPFGITVVCKANGSMMWVDFSTTTRPHVFTATTNGPIEFNSGSTVTAVATSDRFIHVYYFEFNGASSKLYVDGVLLGTFNPGTGPGVGGNFRFESSANGLSTQASAGAVWCEGKLSTGVQLAADVAGEAQTLIAKWGLRGTNAIATGGTLTIDTPTLVEHTFTQNGFFLLPSGGSLPVDYLAVGGGGGAGSNMAGGGAGGEVLSGSTTITAAQYATIGAGGAGASNANGLAGGNTVLGSIVTANGGGFGAKGSGTITAGGNGGNGGGGGGNNVGAAGAGGTGDQFNGGAGSNTPNPWAGGGGGGAGQAGANAVGTVAGKGGNGVTWNGTTYGGGGGGGVHGGSAGTAGAGGTGGGGAGSVGVASTGPSATSGTNGLGGGGGGGGSNAATGGSGGSGVVKIRYNPTLWTP